MPAGRGNRPPSLAPLWLAIAAVFLSMLVLFIMTYPAPR